jgi:hypothetical protein
MGKGSGQSTQTVQTNSTVGPPQWARNAAKDIYDYSTQVADKLKPTNIARPADLTPGQQSLFAALMGNVGAANPVFAGAQNTLTGLQGFKAPTITAQTLAGTNLDPYMNPFTKSVIDTSLATGKDALAIAKNQTRDAAARAGAFGGSRQGVQEAVADAEYAKDAASLAAGLNAQNFAQAQGAAGTDIANNLSAQAQNAGNALSGAGVNLSAATGAAGVASTQQQQYLNSLFAALMGQNQVQGQNQAVNQFNSDVANATNMLPVQRLQLQQGALAGVPLAQTTTGTTTGVTTQPGNSLMQTLGGIIGLGGSIAGMGGPMGFGFWGR